MNKLPLRMRTSIFDDLYLKSDQKVVRLWPDQPDQFLRPYLGLFSKLQSHCSTFAKTKWPSMKLESPDLSENPWKSRIIQVNYDFRVGLGTEPPNPGLSREFRESWYIWIYYPQSHYFQNHYYMYMQPLSTIRWKAWGTPQQNLHTSFPYHQEYLCSFIPRLGGELSLGSYEATRVAMYLVWRQEVQNV